jgi:glutamate synthase domain-containing protein 2
MSPWNMMEYWGVPSIILHSKAWEYANELSKKGTRVVDLAFAGGLAREDHLFKALALGSPFVKLVCMGRALMIPGVLGSNIEGVIRPNRKATVNGMWEKLPPAVAEHGSYPEEIFTTYYDVEEKVGEKEMENIPYGAIALWTLIDKLSGGLQQLMAGARKFSVQEINRNDLFSGNRETEVETGIPFISEIGNDQALKILRE